LHGSNLATLSNGYKNPGATRRHEKVDYPPPEITTNLTMPVGSAPELHQPAPAVEQGWEFWDAAEAAAKNRIIDPEVYRAPEFWTDSMEAQEAQAKSKKRRVQDLLFRKNVVQKWFHGLKYNRGLVCWLFS
ncbi:MAG: hypothetical protein Q9168_006292, partial [Polycauliona sp. 1 TL-2023]